MTKPSIPVNLKGASDPTAFEAHANGHAPALSEADRARAAQAEINVSLARYRCVLKAYPQFTPEGLATAIIQIVPLKDE